MTVRRMIVVVLVSGAATAGAQLAGWGDLGGLMALIHLGGLIGAPLALILNRHLRSTPVMFALSIALSIALSALAAQSLIWFTVATRLALIVTGTAYGAGLAWLLVAEPEVEQAGRL
jgi:hypothetical protein